MKVLLVVYDNDSHIHWFPLGTAYIASALRNAGHDVTIYNKDVYHFPPKHLTRYLDVQRFDFVAVGAVAGYWQYKELLSISKAINASKQRPMFIVGGHIATPEPEYFLKKTGADFIVMGEGEETIVELLTGHVDIKGVSYRVGDVTVTNDRRPPIRLIDDIALPAWDLFPINHYALIREPNIRNKERCLPVITSRGCPYGCNFCYRMDKKVRLRSPESVIEEVSRLKTDHHIRYIAFQDDLFMMSPERAIEMSEAIESLGVRWSCFGRLNHATKEVLRAMKLAGCMYIGYGIESLDDAVLETMNKNLTVEQITKGIKATKSAGISPGFNIIWGNIGETEETLSKGVEFLLKNDDQSQLRTIRPVTPYPGSPLYDYARIEGLLDGVEDFYENKHVNSDLLTVNFTDLSDDEFHKALFSANSDLLTHYYTEKAKAQMVGFKDLYTNKNTSFRGVRQT